MLVQHTLTITIHNYSFQLTEQVKVQTSLSSFSPLWKQSGGKDRNVSDDYAGAAMGASILREKGDKGEVRVSGAAVRINTCEWRGAEDTETHKTVTRERGSRLNKHSSIV